MSSQRLEMLESLYAWKPSSKLELEEWQAKAIELIKLLIDEPLTESGTPEVVIHYLNDADIRFKDSRYAVAQDSALSEALAMIKRA